MASSTMERPNFDESIPSPRPSTITKRATVAQIQLSSTGGERQRLSQDSSCESRHSDQLSPTRPANVRFRKQVTDLGLQKIGWRTSKALVARPRDDVSADSCRGLSRATSRAFSTSRRNSFDDSVIGEKTISLEFSNSLTLNLNSHPASSEESSSVQRITPESLRSLVESRPLLRHLNLSEFIPEEHIEMQSDEFDRTVLGAGGQGRIFLATLKTTGEKVAVKVSNKENVLHEYVLATKLKHQHVLRPIGFSIARVDLADFGEQASARADQWVNMAVYEYCKNGDLLTYLEAHPKMATNSSFLKRVCVNILSALAHIHLLGYVHCDVKPGNILVDGDGDIKLGDLGMCQLVNDNMYAQGTPSYLAPEVVAAWSGVPKSHSCVDMFSFGVSMVYVISHQYPFNRITARLKSRLPVTSAEFALQFRISEQCMSRLQEIDPRYAALAKRCLTLDPASRPSAAELLAEME